MDLHVDKIDWTTWQPTEFATLCFVIRDEQILLIHKKRGLGAGKINGPGGRLEMGETTVQGAVRETIEEIGVRPIGLEQAGELFFQFVDGYKLHVTVFSASDCEGQLIETDEAKPFWTNIASIPYNQMWQDDPYWLPLVVTGRKFRGFFAFQGDRLLNYKVSLHGT